MSTSSQHRTLQPFKYTPLAANEIRVLNIKPAHSLRDPVEATISKIWTSRDPNGDFPAAKYLTLSYAWGPTFPDGSHLTHGIVCNGQWFKTSCHLYDGLRRFRALCARPGGYDGVRYEGLGLWVDAICINQADNEEKSRQVQMMGQIYQHCFAMIVWLGEVSGIWANLSLRRACAKMSDPSPAPDLKPRYNSAVKLFLVRSWFSRRWVVQEVASTTSEVFAWKRPSRHRPNMVLMGEHELQLSKLTDGLFVCGGLHELDGVGLLTTDVTTTLLQRLSIHEQSKCVNDHDLIYALMHASFDIERFGIQVDYLSDLEDLFIKIATTIMHSPGEAAERDHLLALASCRPPGNENSKLASWVPDWRTSSTYLCREHRQAVTKLAGPYGSTFKPGNSPRVATPLLGPIDTFELLGQYVRVQGLVYDWRFHPEDSHCRCQSCRLWKRKNLVIGGEKASPEWAKLMADGSDADAVLFSLSGFEANIYVLKKTPGYVAEWGLRVHKVVFCFQRPDDEKPKPVERKWGTEMEYVLNWNIPGVKMDVCIG